MIDWHSVAFEQTLHIVRKHNNFPNEEDKDKPIL